MPLLTVDVPHPCVPQNLWQVGCRCHLFVLRCSSHLQRIQLVSAGKGLQALSCVLWWLKCSAESLPASATHLHLVHTAWPHSRGAGTPISHHHAVGCSFSTRPHLLPRLVQGAPLVVLNSFGGEEHLKLATVLFQNLFPSINVQNVQLHQCQVSTKPAGVPCQYAAACAVGDVKCAPGESFVVVKIWLHQTGVSTW